MTTSGCCAAPAGSRSGLEARTGSAACRPATATAHAWCSVLSRAGTRTSRRCATARRGPSRRRRRGAWGSGARGARRKKTRAARAGVIGPVREPMPAPKPSKKPHRSPAGGSVTAHAGGPALSNRYDHDDVLVVVSKVKKYIRDRSGMNTSDAVAEALGAHVRKVCDDATGTPCARRTQDGARLRRAARVSALTCRGSAPRAPARAQLARGRVRRLRGGPLTLTLSPLRGARANGCGEPRAPDLPSAPRSRVRLGTRRRALPVHKRIAAPSQLAGQRDGVHGPSPGAGRDAERVGREVPPEERPEQRPQAHRQADAVEDEVGRDADGDRARGRDRVSRAATIRASRNRPVCANRCVPERTPPRRPSPGEPERDVEERLVDQIGEQRAEKNARFSAGEKRRYGRAAIFFRGPDGRARTPTRILNVERRSAQARPSPLPSPATRARANGWLGPVVVIDPSDADPDRSRNSNAAPHPDP